MPEYVVVIDKGGLDTAAERPSYEISKNAITSIKIEIIIDAFETGEVVSDYNYPGESILGRADKRAEAMTSVTSFSHNIQMMRLRAASHSQDYIMLTVDMSEKEMKDARGANPFDGAIDVILSATHIMHGNKDKLHKWITRMEFEKEQGEE